MWTISQLLLGRMLSWLVAFPASTPYDGPLGAVYTGLYIAPTPVLSWTSVMAAITEATYPGYARQEVVWYPPYLPAGGGYGLAGASQRFSPNATGGGNLITGVFLADALTGGNLLASLAWPGLGASLGGPTMAAYVEPAFQFPNSLIYGGPGLSS